MTLGRGMTLIRTAWALGILNIIRVVFYRLKLKFKIGVVFSIKVSEKGGSFFSPFVDSSKSHLSVSSCWRGSTPYFGFHKFPRVNNAIPDWHENPFLESRYDSKSMKWWEIPDFDLAIGDIKVFWEVSRFDWILYFSQSALQGDQQAVEEINSWLRNWIVENPGYNGINWKCGQEASIRVMNLSLSALLLQQIECVNDDLLSFLEDHLKRIAPTVSYAIGQNNNHGTSEAVALFVGGLLLCHNSHSGGEQWAVQGRKLLENRVLKLVDTDGSFSQYSVNYHRMLLDSLSIAEVFRRKFNGEPFSDEFYSRAKAATSWLHSMTDPQTGYGPNIGANDGVRLWPFTATNHRDLRPSVHTAAVLFLDLRGWDSKGLYDEHLEWLDIRTPSASIAPVLSKVFDGGGYAILVKNAVKVVMRYPRFRFRPSQSDALHVDIWLSGKNMLRDGGTYSYNGCGLSQGYFSGVQSHNTIQFDDRDQMPRLSRFLFGDWLKGFLVEPLSSSFDEAEFAAGYRDRIGATHVRRIALKANSIQIVDDIKGVRAKATLRWRLAPGAWRLLGLRVVGECGFEVKIDSSEAISRIEIVTGWESEYYMQRSEISVLEIEIQSSGRITTHFSW